MFINFCDGEKCSRKCFHSGFIAVVLVGVVGGVVAGLGDLGCSCGLFGDGGGGGPGWRGHYNAVNTFKFWMLKKTKTKMFKTESSASTRLVFRGLLLVVVAAGEFHWHFTCGFNFRYGLRKLFDQSQRG